MKLALRAQSPSIRRVETVEAPADASIALAILAFLGERAPPRTPVGASAVRPRAVGADPVLGAPPATASGPRGDRRPSLPGLTGSPSTHAKNASGAGGADPIPSGHRAARATAAYGRPGSPLRERRLERGAERAPARNLNRQQAGRQDRANKPQPHEPAI